MKRVLANNQQVAHYFANRVQDEGSGSNFFFENDRLYSYGKHFCIARHLPGGAVAFTTRTHSVSTAKHLSYARQALRGQRIVYCNDPDANASSNREAAERAIVQELDNAASKRRIRPETREGHRIAALNLAERFNEYLEALPNDERGAVLPFEVNPDDAEELRHAQEQRREQEAREAEARRARQAESQRDALAAWLAGGPNNGGMSALPVALRLAKSNGTYHTGGLLPDTGSEGRDVIQTSHGAEVPLSDARMLWTVLQDVRSGTMSGESALRMVRRVGVYNVNAFHADGSMRIGCHEISWEAFADMAARLDALGLLNPAPVKLVRPSIGFKRVPIESWATNGSVPGLAKHSKYAKWDGEQPRPPRKGELYLSGAVVVAYRAKDDMSAPYFIAIECQE